MLRTIDEVVETLRNAQKSGRQCSLLIGAGCSVKAGIPRASGFVEIIEKRYPQAYARAKEKTYPKCMAELSPGERHDLVAEYVDKAKINWAHVGIAQLMKNGFVDRILTTNFDLLAVRACALVGVFPANYDFAASQLYKAADIPDQAVFYLHGQRTGFVLMNTEEECKKHAKLMAPVFRDAGRGRVWLVVGYSGENDPVFDRLAKVKHFDHCLYWVGYRDHEPDDHIRERLLVDGKYAFYVKGFDADDFFVTLAQKLGCFPPDFVRRPFSHLAAQLEVLTAYSMPGQDGDVDVTEEARKAIQTAAMRHEKPTRTKRRKRGRPTPEEISSAALEAQSHLMAGNYEEVIAIHTVYEGDSPKELADAASWAYVGQGNALADQGRSKMGEEAEQQLVLAGEMYEAALRIDEDSYGALYNWGITLTHLATLKVGEEAEGLFALSGEKYQAAIKIRPDFYKALNNWGYTLMERGKIKRGKEADQLFTAAREKLLEADSISTGEAAYNLACLSAVLGEEDECREWLEKSKEAGELPPRKHLETDADLNSVRDGEWFKNFLSEL